MYPAVRSINSVVTLNCVSADHCLNSFCRGVPTKVARTLPDGPPKGPPPGIAVAVNPNGSKLVVPCSEVRRYATMFLRTMPEVIFQSDVKLCPNTSRYPGVENELLATSGLVNDLGVC